MLDNKVFIIAEAGVNHNGDFDTALKMIEVAKEVGADAIKFQVFKTENFVSKYAIKAEYQLNYTDDFENQFQMLKKLELSFDNFVKLKEYCEELGIKFLASPFDLESIEFLDKIGLEIFKVPSGEITNLPYLEKIGKLNKKIIISTGMATLGEIEDALDVLFQNGSKRENIIVLHCNTDYPTPIEDVNLKAMLTIKEAFKIRVGYSDHTLGIEVPIAAVALGAEVIEKHFTLDKNMIGPDHKASLNPIEFKMMVLAIRNIEKALGDGIKKPSFSETKNIPITRKYIVAKKDIKKGEKFTEENLTVKRTGKKGISPMKLKEIIGLKSPFDFKQDEIIYF